MTALLEVLRLMFWLGCTAFGGPAAHIAMLRQAVVIKRKWLSDQEFLDYLAIVQLIPGPNSTELVMHVALKQAGWRGLWLGGAAFIVPAASITLGFAVLYQQFGTTAIAKGILMGIKPVVIAVIIQAISGLLRPALKTSNHSGLAILAFLGYLSGINELVLLLVLTAVFLLWSWYKKLLTLEPISTGILFLLFLKIGATLYGSGYVLIAYLKNEFLTRGWLSESQLLTAVAIGQLTPGPVFSSATFVGYQIAGFSGALVATLGIFLPAFVLVWLTNPLVQRLRTLAWTARVLDSFNAITIGLMCAVTALLFRDAIQNVPTALILIISSVGLVRFQINSTWLITFGALIGVILV